MVRGNGWQKEGRGKKKKRKERVEGRKKRGVIERGLGEKCVEETGRKEGRWMEGRK